MFQESGNGCFGIICLGVPYFNGIIFCASGNELSIVAEGERDDSIGMAGAGFMRVGEII